jgi:hypothetical protein
MQLEEAIHYVKAQLSAHGDSWVLDKAQFEAVSGVGLNITDADIQGWIDG